MRIAIASTLLLGGLAFAQEGLDAASGGADAGVPVFETVVVGTPETQAPGSVHTIKASRLNRFELDDPAVVLQSVPGVYVRGEDGFGLRPNIGLRGANADRSKKITLLEDGVLFGPAPYSAPAAYFFPLITRMETVRVIKGPGAIAYGPQTVGGAVEYVTRDAAEGTRAQLDVSFGQYLSTKTHGWLSAGSDTTAFVVEGIQLRSAGFKQLDGGGDTGFDRTEFMAKLKHRLSVGEARHTFTLKAGISTEISNETYLGLTDADFRLTPLRRYAASALDRMEWIRTQFTASHKLEWNGLAVNTTAYRHDFDRTWRKVNRFRGAAVQTVLSAPDTPRNAIYYSVLTGESEASSPGEVIGIGPNHRTFVSQGVQSVARLGVRTGPITHALELQARYHFDSIDRRHTEDGFLIEGLRPVPVGDPTQTLVLNRDATHAFSASFTDALRWGPVTLTPGVRLEVIQSESLDRLLGTLDYGAVIEAMPGVGAHVALTDNLGLLAGVYRGFSPPAPGQPEAVLPESSINTEAGARWTRPGERLEAIGFFNAYSNLTDICTFSNGCIDTNLDRQFDAGQAQVFGLEVFGEKVFRFGPVSVPLSLAYTLTGSSLLESFKSADPQLGDVEAGDELPYVPNHVLNVSGGFETSRVGLFGTLSYIAPMRELAGQGDWDPAWTTDPQVTFDVHLGVKLNEWASLYGDVRNVFDNHAIVGRRPFGARPNAPRTAIVGLKLTY